MKVRFPLSLAALAILAGCATTPAQIARAPEPLVCPPAEKPVCPAPTPTPPPPAPPTDYRGKLQPAAWADLPQWGSESVRGALDAFARSCVALEKQVTWKNACARLKQIAPDASEGEVSSFFELEFDPFQVVNADDST